MHASKPELVSILRRVPLFTDLSEREITVIAESVSSSQYEQGATIFSEGDACDELLIVAEGMVKILKLAPNGRQQLIGIERRGSTLAEVPLFDGGRHPASAEAASTVILLRLPADNFRSICLQNPELSLKVFKVLGHRLRHLVRLVEDLSFSTVRSRLIAHLLQLAEAKGFGTANGVQFELSENNEELAARLGTVRELVSRNLGRLHGSGLIQMKKRTVTIPDLAELKDDLSKTP